LKGWVVSETREESMLQYVAGLAGRASASATIELIQVRYKLSAVLASDSSKLIIATEHCKVNVRLWEGP
jgi:hypothetical protein